MIKVYQRLVDRRRGDCMQAAIASLLELDYDDTPKFIEHESWFHPLFDLVRNKGILYNGFLHNPLDKTNVAEDCFVGSLGKHPGYKGYFYASVYSPKYFDRTLDQPWPTHAVIIDKDYNIVHDPNPENVQVDKYPMSDEIGYNGIVNILLLK